MAAQQREHRRRSISWSSRARGSRRSSTRRCSAAGSRAATRPTSSPPCSRAAAAAPTASSAGPLDVARRVAGRPPITGYDDLTAAEVVAELDGMSGADLRQVREYERANANRKTVLGAVERKLALSLRLPSTRGHAPRPRRAPPAAPSSS